MERRGEARSDERPWVATLFSVALHAAVLLLVTQGPPGVPWGVSGGIGRLYTLSYLGELSGAGSGVVRVTAAATEAHPAPAPGPAPRPAVKPVRPPVRSAGQLLSSTRGKEEVPLPAKAREAREPSATPEPETSREADAGAPGGSGDGPAGLPPPPKGTSMVSGLPRLVYPKGAQNAGVKGTVGLRVVVGPEGRPLRVEVERSSGEASLDEYARRAIERGLVTNAWSSTYVLRVEARFLGGAPEVAVVDEPVEVGG